MPLRPLLRRFVWALTAAWFSCHNSAVSQTLQIDLSQTDQQYLGFGAQIWAGDTDGHDVLSSMNARYARVQHGVNFFTFASQPPTDGNATENDNFTAMKNYIAQNFNGPGGSEPWHLPSITNTSNWANANGVELIVNEFQIPYSFLNAQNTQMPTSRVDDFATFWGAMLSYLDDNGIRPAYIEMANEPNGTWNGRISATNYNSLVEQTRTVLDTHGFADVGILGPGLNVLGETNWIDSLATTSVNSLAGWSTHAWDDDLGIDTQAQIFENAIDAKDPSKPVFITEFATDKLTFNGTTYGDPDSGGDAADQPVFAVEVINNVISLVNHGAGSLLYWEGADQPWNSINWGLERLNGSKRPVYHALRSLTDRLPNDSTVIEQTWIDKEISAAAFLKDDQLIVVLANIKNRNENRTLDFTNVPGELEFIEGVQFEDGIITALTDSVSNNSISVSLLRESVQTLVFDIIDPRIPGDFDENGLVNGLDFLRWQNDISVGDLVDWESNYGSPLNSFRGVSVPEPTNAALILIALCLRVLQPSISRTPDRCQQSAMDRSYL